MAEGISRKPAELAAQCQQAGTAIPTELNWPATAPGSLVMLGHFGAITQRLTTINGLEAQLRTERQALKGEVDAARDDMSKVDHATDLLYGPDGGQKQNYGLTPKKTTQTASGTPEQLVIEKTDDGVATNSIFVDFTSVDGASYEVQWSTTSDFTVLTGSVTVTESAFEIPGLQAGTQYWIRARAVRANQHGPWSDPATRVANV